MTNEQIEAIKDVATQFFFQWYNDTSGGNNTYQGFDTWSKSTKGRELMEKLEQSFNKQQDYILPDGPNKYDDGFPIKKSKLF